MSKVFLLDTNYKPLNPIHPAKARQYLRNRKAAIYDILLHQIKDYGVGFLSFTCVDD